MEWTQLTDIERAEYIKTYSFPITSEGVACLPPSGTPFSGWMRKAADPKERVYIQSAVVRSALAERGFALVKNGTRWRIHPDTPLANGELPIWSRNQTTVARAAASSVTAPTAAQAPTRAGSARPASPLLEERKDMAQLRRDNRPAYDLLMRSLTPTSGPRR